MTTVAPARTRPGLGRSLVVIAATAAAMMVADVAASYVVVFALFGSPWGLLGLVVVAVLLVAVVAAIGRTITGRAHVVGAIVVTVLLASLGAYGLLHGILAPVPFAAVTPLHLALCVLCAVTLGLFLGPWPVSAIGLLAGVGVVVLIALQPTAAQTAAADSASRATADAAHQRADFLASGIFPDVTDLTGWRAAQVRATGADAESRLVSDDGAVATVLVQGPVASVDPTSACSSITQLGDVGTPGPDGLLPWCTATPTGWARLDRTAVAFVDGDRFVVLSAAPAAIVQEVAGTSSATPADLAALAGSLHPMSRADVEAYVLDSYAGADSPVVVLPAAAHD